MRLQNRGKWKRLPGRWLFLLVVIWAAVVRVYGGSSASPLPPKSITVPHAGVASANYLASRVGVEIMRQGGKLFGDQRPGRSDNHEEAEENQQVNEDNGADSVDIAAFDQADDRIEYCGDQNGGDKRGQHTAQLWQQLNDIEQGNQSHDHAQKFKKEIVAELDEVFSGHW